MKPDRTTNRCGCPNSVLGLIGGLSTQLDLCPNRPMVTCVCQTIVQQPTFDPYKLVAGTDPNVVDEAPGPAMRADVVLPIRAELGDALKSRAFEEIKLA